MKKLIKLLERENKKQLKEALKDIKTIDKDYILDHWYYKEKLTNLQIKKYNADELTTKQIKEILKNKIIKEYQTRFNKNIKRIETIAQASDDITSINISINWVKSSTWGYNPHATITTNNGTITEGKASGCGYDKESSAIAEALNKNNDILKLMYNQKNKKATLKNNVNRDLLGCGSGYGVLPYFEGGVGVSSLMNIFKKLGYKVQEQHTRNNDYYYISK